MRQWVLAAAAVTAAAAWGAGTAQAGKVEIKGAHVCCGKCVAAIKGVLKKVDGVSDADAQKAGDITFTTKDDKTTTAALSALADAGFTGAATDDGKEVKIDLPTASGKADQVSVTTHICCPACKAAITKAFPDDKVSFEGNTATISGKDVDKAAVLDTLRKAGFNGTIK
jgi:copper chaperone CopZ